MKAPPANGGTPGAGPPAPRVRGRSASRPRNAKRQGRWWNEPRSAVLILLAAVVGVGGARKLLQMVRARRAVVALDDPDVSPETIAAVVEHGRAGLLELFRLLEHAGTAPQRTAAGHALSVLWARDELIAEEEKAIVRRGYEVHWRGRRRYPRGMHAAIPFVVDFGVPFLRDDGAGVHPADLEWSYRITGARRARLETFTPWAAGPGRAEFSIVPSDFDTNGPHRLVLQARARTRGLTDSWELDLPHVPFPFELDSRLEVASLLTLPDDSRAASIARSVRLVVEDRGDSSDVVPLTEGFAVRGLPVLEVTTPLPCDLAHTLELAIAGVEGWHRAGAVVVRGGTSAGAVRVVPGALAALPAGAIDRPGGRGVRARLVADPDLGWSDPDVRSVWPGTVVTEQVGVEIVRL